ncbi:MAG: hypothetical protein M9887_07370 [Chitinophagales bacterium]|nr:hypothetical protein [Chitinophagales bacterium]
MSSDANNTEIKGMKEVIQKVVAVGSDFLSHKISPEKMTHTMVDAVDTYFQNVGGVSTHSYEAQELIQVLMELKACGSGYLAQRCDAACVARTITFMVDNYSYTEFGS